MASRMALTAAQSIEYTITGHPYVKKSNQKVVYNKYKGRQVKVNTPAYSAWAETAMWQIKTQGIPKEPIDQPINLCCRFYLKTRGRVDLSALYEGIQDVLVKMGVLADDNYQIVASHDGSGAFYDKDNPRMVVMITPKVEQ